MKKHIIIFLLLSAFLQSCIHFHAGYKSVQYNENKPLVFPMNFNKALYKTNIHFLNKDFSGLMLFKHMEDEHATRIVFMSEFGLKFFDFKLADNGAFSVEFIIDEMNKKSLVSILEKDLKLLFQKEVPPAETKYFYHKKQTAYMQKYKPKSGRNYYFFDKENKQISRIEYSGALFKKIKISLDNYQQSIPQSIDIKHINMALRLQLKLIK